MPTTDDATQAWRDGLVTGDEVAVCVATPKSTMMKACTVRVTPTLLCTDIARFRRSDGEQVGREAYTMTTLTVLPLTDARRAEILAERQHRQAVRRCQRTRWEEQSLAVLTAVIAALNASA